MEGSVTLEQAARARATPEAPKLEAREVSVTFKTRTRTTQAVDKISLQLTDGEFVEIGRAHV